MIDLQLSVNASPRLPYAVGTRFIALINLHDLSPDACDGS